MTAQLWTGHDARASPTQPGHYVWLNVHMEDTPVWTAEVEPGMSLADAAVALMGYRPTHYVFLGILPT